jgi:hypothetical protein
MYSRIPTNYEKWNTQLLEATTNTRWDYTLFPHSGAVTLWDTKAHKMHSFDSVHDAIDFIANAS